MVQAADDAEAGCGGELQQVEEQMAALDEELARQGGTQAPASMPPCCPTLDIPLTVQHTACYSAWSGASSVAAAPQAWQVASRSLKCQPCGATMCCCHVIA